MRDKMIGAVFYDDDMQILNETLGGEAFAVICALTKYAASGVEAEMKEFSQAQVVAYRFLQRKVEINLQKYDEAASGRKERAQKAAEMRWSNARLGNKSTDEDAGDARTGPEFDEDDDDGQAGGEDDGNPGIAQTDAGQGENAGNVQTVGGTDEEAGNAQTGGGTDGIRDAPSGTDGHAENAQTCSGIDKHGGDAQQCLNANMNRKTKKKGNTNICVSRVRDGSRYSACAREEDHEVHLGEVFSDRELDELHRQRTTEIPAIEQMMRNCGADFAPADEDIARELLTENSCEDILKAIRIAKESGAVTWRYIRGILRRKKEGEQYGGGRDSGKVWNNAGAGKAEGGSGTGSGNRTHTGRRKAEKPSDNLPESARKYLESTYI